MSLLRIEASAVGTAGRRGRGRRGEDEEGQVRVKDPLQHSDSGKPITPPPQLLPPVDGSLGGLNAKIGIAIVIHDPSYGVF